MLSDHDIGEGRPRRRIEPLEGVLLPNGEVLRFYFVAKFVDFGADQTPKRGVGLLFCVTPFNPGRRL